MTDTRNLSIDGNRLWDSIMDMAKIGATEKGGCNRLELEILGAAAIGGKADAVFALLNAGF